MRKPADPRAKDGAAQESEGRRGDALMMKAQNNARAPNCMRSKFMGAGE